MVPRESAALALAYAEQLLTAAPSAGIDLGALAAVVHRLRIHEDELQRTAPSPRRSELEGLVIADLETLCVAYKRMEAAVGWGGEA